MIRKVGKVGMTETDKLLVRIGTARDAISRKTEQTSLDYMIDGVLMNCAVMLKEQDEIIQRILSEKMDELNNKNMMLQNELQNIEMKKLMEIQQKAQVMLYKLD